MAIFKTRKARAIELPVSAPFHCALMRPAEERLAVDLAALAFHDAAIPVVANVSAEVVTDAEQIRRNLVAQVCAPVRWVESVRLLAARGVTTFVEVGPKTVLSGLVRQIAPEAVTLGVDSPETLEAAEAALASATS
jgi:[acyl-carrier-protein] S-malonyltransferase